MQPGTILCGFTIILTLAILMDSSVFGGNEKTNNSGYECSSGFIALSSKPARKLRNILSSKWERDHLEPPVQADPKFSKPLFWDLGQRLTDHLSGASFSNELPWRLVSQKISDERTDLVNNAGLGKLISLGWSEPIIHQRFLTNMGIGFRNVIGVTEKLAWFTTSSANLLFKTNGNTV